STVITIQATGGSPVRTHTATFTLVVSGFFDFTLAASPSTLTLTPGVAGGVETATATLNASATTSPVTFSILTTLPTGVTASAFLSSGTTSPVTFSILTTLPAGVTASAFSNSPCSPTCMATVTFTAASNAPASSTLITIQASGGSPVVTQTATFTLVVSGFFGFTLAASPASLSITDGALGGVETATVTLTAIAPMDLVTFC